MFYKSLVQRIKKIFFPFYKNSEINFVFKRLQDGQPKNYKTAMFVGGCVRKYLSNEDIDDIDIATTLNIDEIKEKFKETNFKVIESGLKHGSLTLVSKKLKLEITTLRKDIKTDGRHAEIEITDNWQLDSNRRDFTINAIYLDINGKVFDPQFGTNDLKNCNVKFIGDPQKRIEEDYLRILRFIRFSVEYGSQVEATTIKAIKLNLDGIKQISKERIFIELLKILSLKNFLSLAQNKDLKEIFLLIFPELKYLDRLNKLIEFSNELLLDNTTLLAILLIDEKDNHEYFFHKYNVSNNLKNDLILISKNFKNLKMNKSFFKQDLKKNIFYFGKNHLTTLNKIYFSENKKIKISNYLEILKEIKKSIVPEFHINGTYLKNRGIKEGTYIGKILKILEDEWIKNDFKLSDQKVEEIILNYKN